MYKQEYIESVCNALNVGGEDELLAACGYGGIPLSTVLVKLGELLKRDTEKEESKRSTEAIIEKLRAHAPRKSKNTSGILVKGERDVMVRMAQCCNPVPGDDIIGYITRGRGISIHRADCSNIGHSKEELERMIEVSWDTDTSEIFHVSIEIQAYDRNGMLMEIMAVLSELKINIVTINAKVEEDTKNVNISLVIDIKDLLQLDFVMTKLRRIRDVYAVRRASGGT